MPEYLAKMRVESFQPGESEILSRYRYTKISAASSESARITLNTVNRQECSSSTSPKKRIFLEYISEIEDAEFRKIA